MNLRRTPLLIEQQPVPTDPEVRERARRHIGYPPPGMVRKTGYPAGKGKGAQGRGIDDEYPCTKEGKRLAKAHAWQFPSKIVKACGKIYRY